VIKGKQKSQSLCNFNQSNSNLTNTHVRAQSKLDQAAIYNSINGEQSRSPTLSKSSDESEQLEKMMMIIMNNTTVSSWPVLKIEDSFKGSISDVNETMTKRNSRNSSRLNSAEGLYSQINNLNGHVVPSILVSQPKTGSNINQIEQIKNNSNDLYIPNNVRSALESAGINIEQIINLTNKMELSLNPDRDSQQTKVNNTIIL